MSINEPGLPPGLKKKFDGLKAILTGYRRMALAFSGGTDSAFLLAAARAAGLQDILAVVVVSQFYTPREKARALKFARDLGVEPVCLDLDILSREKVVQNDARRCYYCKHLSFSMVGQAAAQRGTYVLVHGINVDDLGDYRPGIEAAEELGFKAPLVSAGFSKGEIRESSRALGLNTWDLPSQSCLATRIPMGTQITREQLKMVSQAEDLLREIGLNQVRVRCHDRLARIEIPQEGFGKIMMPGVRDRVYNGLRRLGFAFVSLDLGGYATGKMNPVPGLTDDKE